MTHFSVSPQLVEQQAVKVVKELVLHSRMHELEHLDTVCLAGQDDKDDWGKSWNKVTEYLRKEVLAKRREEIEAEFAKGKSSD